MSKVKRIVLFSGMWGVLLGCNANKEEKECVDPPKTESKAGAVSEDGSKKGAAAAKKDADWCRACVVGPHGFMSCQRKTAEPSETREQLKERARLAACTDSGFTEEQCPKDKVIGLVCKGDPEPTNKREAGSKLLKALKSSGPLVLTDDKEAMERLRKKMKQKDPSATESPAPIGSAESPSGTPKE